MYRKIQKILLFGLVLALCAGCSSPAASDGSSSAAQTDSSEASDGGNSAGTDARIIDQIKDRGFLIAGCKMDVPDLSYYDAENDSWSGIEVDIAYETAAKIFGVTADEARDRKLVSFTGVTVADREEKLANGEIDCMIATYTITRERAERFAISESYYTDYIGLMVRTSGDDPNSVGSGDIRSIADLDGKYIGVPRNATTREDFINYINTMNNITINPIFCEYESYEQLFKALKDGNIDVMSVDVSILKGYADKNTRILGDRFAGQNYGAAVTKENAALLDIINQVISERR